MTLIYHSKTFSRRTTCNSLEGSIPKELTALEEGVVKSQKMDFSCLLLKEGFTKKLLKLKGPSLDAPLPWAWKQHVHKGIRQYLCTLSRVRLLVNPWTVARQAPLSMGLPRQEYWSGLPCPPPGDLPIPEIKPGSSASPAFGRQILYQWVTWEAPLHKGICSVNFSKLRFFNSNQLREFCFYSSFPVSHVPSWETMK